MQPTPNLPDLLLSISYEIAQVRNKKDMLALINDRLKALLPFSHGGIGIADKVKGTYTALLIDPAAAFLKDPATQRGIKEEFPINNNVINRVLETEEVLVFDLDEAVKRPDVPLYITANHAKGMKEMTGVALRNETGSFGFFTTLSPVKNGFTKQHLQLLQYVARFISIAVANILAAESLLERESEKSLLLSLSRDIVACRTKADVEDIVVNRLGQYFRFNEIMICLDNEDKLTHTNYIHTISGETRSHPDFARGAAMKYYIKDGIYDVIQQSEEPVVFDMHQLMKRKNRPYYVDFFYQNHVRTLIGFNVAVNKKSFGAVYVYVKQQRSFTEAQLRLARAVCSHIAIAIANIRTYEKMQRQLAETDQYNSKLEKENQYLHQQIQLSYTDREMIGAGDALRAVYQAIRQVAASDSTVLLMGETGTGKELAARAIHNASPRKDQPMVKVNCAALPSHLIESVLFGHERGSFTGATERQLGKFELAKNGTLFLDEIGEMTPELQVKLLRAIQEKEIERIGGKASIKTDVRIITATNRDLKQEVEAGRFRADLFYRLNVFPIKLPPLRERKEDIPVLALHFMLRFAQKTGKQLRKLSPKVLKAMMQYDWPGNIRELEHLVERSVLLTNGDTIQEMDIPQGLKYDRAIYTGPAVVKTIHENEREYILSILKKANGRIKGRGGAAEILKIPPTTLYSKIKKLGIRKTTQ